MNNPAGKVEMVMEMYNHGMLCKCETWVLIEETEDFYLEHDDTCCGRVTARELLGFESEDKNES